MATYRALAEKARHFDSLPEVQEALAAAGDARARAAQRRRRRSRTRSKAESEQLDALAERGYFNERLDQLVVDVLLGVR